MKEKRFTNILMKWHKHSNSREMPWKGEKDPYKIWLSEVILQQTRVAQGWQYYSRFIKKYPTISKLAKAKDQDVFKLWEGLGYYSRCKNLLLTARQIEKQNKGIFPNAYEDILALKGIGPYTAAAIASFAYNLPHAVVDGNVYRVLSRFFGVSVAIDSTKGKSYFHELAESVLYKKEAGLFNQAIMDFGAVVCKPFSPICINCPLQKHCIAFKEGRVNQLPVKEKRLVRKNRWFYYFLFEYDNKVLVHKRIGKDIWQNLFEFYLVETEKGVIWNTETIKNWLFTQTGIQKTGEIAISPVMAQELTHQHIKGQFIRVVLTGMPSFLSKYQWQSKSTLRNLPFPNLITRYLGI